MGEYPLIIMPQKYVQESFRVTKGYFQTLRPKELNIIKTYIEKGSLYTVPPQCLDDYYWMLASVSAQTKSRNGFSGGSGGGNVVASLLDTSSTTINNNMNNDDDDNDNDNDNNDNNYDDNENNDEEKETTTKNGREHCDT